MSLLEENLTLNFDLLSQETQEEISDLLQEDCNVEDEASTYDISVPEHYDITSYGADFDVEGLVKRLKRGDILIPDFQRSYVWNLQMASRFIESLLLGLPVPGIFLAKDSNTSKLLVIDGQQRLKTLQFFYEGCFHPKLDEKQKRVFALQNVQPKFEGITYEDLDDKDKIKLNDYLIHATVVKQDSPEDNNTSVFHIFERLNNGGLKLTSQEIRTAVYHGEMIELVKKLNDYPAWRTVFGTHNKRLKDQELILRFLAFFYTRKEYKQSMETFLNNFAKRYQNANSDFIFEATSLFQETIDMASSRLGQNPFRPDRALNAAVFDSVMVGLAVNKEKIAQVDDATLQNAYHNLLKDEEYQEHTSRHTSHENSVVLRMKKAIDIFERM